MSLFASLQRWRTAESARKAKTRQQRGPLGFDVLESRTLLSAGLSSFLGRPRLTDAVAKQAGPKTVIPPTSADTLTLSAPAILRRQ